MNAEAPTRGLRDSLRIARIQIRTLLEVEAPYVFIRRALKRSTGRRRRCVLFAEQALASLL
jgi:hypothetical protein